MFVKKSRLSKMFTLALLLSAPLIATVPAQAGVYTDKAKNIGKTALKTGWTAARIAAVPYFLKQIHSCKKGHKHFSGFNDKGPALFRQMFINQGVINLALAAMATKSLYDDAQIYMKEKAAKEEAAQ